MQLEFAAIHFRKKILAEQRQQRKRKHAKSQEADGEDHAVGDAALQQTVVAVAQPLEMNFERLLHAYKGIGGGFGRRARIFFGAGLQ